MTFRPSIDRPPINICCPILLVASLCASSAHAVVHFSDTFDYADGQLTASLLGGMAGDDVSGGLWAPHSGDTFDDNVNVISGQAEVRNSGSEDVNRTAGATMEAGDTWYYGALFTVNDTRVDPSATPINEDYFIHFKDDTFGFRGRAYLTDPVGGGDYTIGHSASSGGLVSAWDSDLNFGEENKILVSYDFDTGESRLWLNPTDISSTSLMDTNDEMTSIVALALRQDFISPGDPNNEILINAVAVGDNFGEVMTALVPEPTSFALVLFALPLLLRRKLATHRPALQIVALAILVVVVGSATTRAGTTNFGDFIADDVMFMQVIEENFEAGPLYDVTGTSGNTLTIDPLNFGVEIDPNPGDAVPQSDLIDSDLRMTIMAADGFSIDEVQLSENGDYQVSGSGSVNAVVSYFWDIIEVDNNAVLISGNGMAPLNASGGLWDVELILDLAQELTDAGMSGDITKVRFRFDNTLSGSVADDGSFAFIKKKHLGGVRITVPEPNSILPLLCGCLGLILVRRHKA